LFTLTELQNFNKHTIHSFVAKNTYQNCVFLQTNEDLIMSYLIKRSAFNSIKNILMKMFVLF